jgi:flagellar hook-associated protein 1 FlgK
MAAVTDLLYLSNNGLQAHQSRINAASQNISNVDTKGYSRRSVALTTGSAETGPGVHAGELIRYFNSMGSAALLREESSTSFHTQLAQSLSELETLSGTASGGLYDALQEFEDAWRDVAASPEDLAARTVLLTKSASLANQFNVLAERYDSFVQGTASETLPVTGQSADVVAEINTLTERLQALNKNITKAELTGRSVPDLCDERDRLVRQLAGNVNISVTPDYRITLGGQELVSANGANRQPFVQSAPTAFSVGGNDVSASLTGGKLAALTGARSVAVSLGEQLDQLAANLAAGLNSLFDSGYNLNGETPADQGYTFFTGTTAADLAVDTALYDPANPMNTKPKLIAAATASAIGDNRAAQSVCDWLQAPVAALNGQSVSDFWLQTETALAGAVAEEQQAADIGQKMLNMLSSEMDAVSGVSLDEEVVNLMSAQRAYEACARVMSTANKLLDTLMSMTG